jgi:aspartyl-tRNA(Asn)/glutamyl-tRNA(Gln) amidotransferase subunit A
MTAQPTLDIVGAGHLLRSGRLTSLELTRSCLDRIDALNPQLNAFITITRDEALTRAKNADHELAAGHDRGPLHGIPISLKDIIDQRGVVTTAASRARDPVAAAADAPVTAVLREAGAVFVGKTNLHEFALGTTSDESAFGPVRHWLDDTRSPGGSSGGSAVAVATGMSLASIGTDTGGSIRIPAAACGMVGLKPGLGEVRTDAVVPLSRTLDHVGPITRTVTDAALIYTVLTGVPTTMDPESLRGRRLGVLQGYFTARLEPAVRTACDRAVHTLQEAGALIDTLEIPHAFAIPAIYLGILFSEAAAYHGALLDERGDRYTPGVRQRLEAARYVLGEDYVRAMAGRDVIRDEVDHALEGRHALIAPGLVITAPEIGAATVSIDKISEPVRSVMLRATQPFNVTGHPALVLPCGTDARNLPCSLQVIGRRGATPDLLALALGCEAQIRGFG